MSVKTIEFQPLGSLANVEICTDGSCPGNPGPGGWAVVLSYNDAAAGVRHRREVAGYCCDFTTKDRMALTAVLQAIRLLKCPSRVAIRSYSQYVVEGLEKHLSEWRTSGLPRRLRNIDLWRGLEEASRRHVLTGVWIRCDGCDPDNVRCLELATGAAKRRKNHDRRMPPTAVFPSRVTAAAT